MNAEQRAARLAQALADPLRLALLQSLMAGPAMVADLVTTTGAAQPNVSNHLAVLRAQGLVLGERRGRQMVYRIANPTVAQLVEALSVVAGIEPRRPRRVAPLAAGRTCYDHLAGSLGVAIFDALVAAGVLLPPDPAAQPGKLGPAGAVALGPAAGEVFAGLGIDVAAARGTRRQFAYACRDWTERRFHLGGALGAAVHDRFVAAGWIARQPGSRVIRLTVAGAAALRHHLGLTLPANERASDRAMNEAM